MSLSETSFHSKIKSKLVNMIITMSNNKLKEEESNLILNYLKNLKLNSKEELTVQLKKIHQNVHENHDQINQFYMLYSKYSSVEVDKGLVSSNKLDFNVLNKKRIDFRKENQGFHRGELSGIRLGDEKNTNEINCNTTNVNSIINQNNFYSISLISNTQSCIQSDSNLNKNINNTSITHNLNSIISSEKNKEEIEIDDVDIDIEISNDPIPFLADISSKNTTSNQTDNFKLITKQEGSLHISAINQSEQAKGRRELKEHHQRLLLESLPDELKSNAVYQKTLLNQIKDVSYSASYEQLEWKFEDSIKKFQSNFISNSELREKRKELPIFKLRDELLNELKKNNVLIVIGETGSGKTTQITQYLYETGYCRYGKIGCTQPRRVAAMSVAKRVAEEFGCKLGDEVGYSIRFEDCSNEKTIIKYMTDGMLLREALIDNYFSSYSVIMLDEAHERTINTDILFGLLKIALQKRNDLKVIITSATLDADKFSQFFDNAKIFRIPGRTYHVDIFYTKEPETDYFEAALEAVIKIHIQEPIGDILLFLTGQEEIDSAVQILTERMKSIKNKVKFDLLILPVYSSLPSEMQTKIFEIPKEGIRKCVIATNIAEASLTIDGIYYVIDPGFSKIKAYNPKTGMDSLVVVPICKSSAIQRAGRAGRTGPGKCYRLYTLEAYNTEMRETAVPEIQRTNLANTVLLLKAMGINDLIKFNFMDAPSTQALVAAMEQLYYLGSLDDDGLLTKLGKKMSEFPLDPQLSKMLLASCDLGCSQEVIIIISMLSVQNIFYRPRDKQQQADNKRSKFHYKDGDHLTLLNVYNLWKKNQKSSNWCYENFIQYRGLKKASDVEKQLLNLMDRFKLPILSCGNNLSKVRKSITAGFFTHVARRDNTEGYRTLLDNQTVFIHPSSSLFNSPPEWVVYHELVLTSKEYMRDLCTIDPRWLIDVSQKFFKINSGDILSRRKMNEKLEPLYNKYEDPNAWRLSKRRYGK